MFSQFDPLADVGLEHGDRLQRFARREILAARNDLLRTNPYWRTYEGSRWLIDYYIRWHRRRSLALESSSNSPNSGLAQSVRLAESRMHEVEKPCAMIQASPDRFPSGDPHFSHSSKRST